MVRSPGQRAGLDADAVLAAAREVVRERGAAGLSMRSVAARLGVAPNALYSHVENRTALVDAVLDDILGGVPVPDVTGAPRDELFATMLSTFDVLVQHADLVPLYLARGGADGAKARALGAAMHVLLERAGLAEEPRGAAVRVLVVHTMGVAAQATAEGGVLTTEYLRGTLATSLGWLLDGAVGACE